MGGEEAGEEAGSAHQRSAWRSERRDVTRKSINIVVLVGDRNSCYRGLGNRSRSGYVSVYACVFNTRGGATVEAGTPPR